MTDAHAKALPLWNVEIVPSLMNEVSAPKNALSPEI